jgi:hypothetical protein
MYGIMWYFKIYTMYKDQIKVIGISITSLNIDHFFVLETFKILSTSYFGTFN